MNQVLLEPPCFQERIYHMNKTKLEKYAELAIKTGLNVQKGQNVLINASVHAISLTRLCVEEAYKAGAKRVIVFYSDEQITKHHYHYQDVEVLKDIHPWQIDCKLDYFKEGACILHIISEVPGILKGIDTSKISAFQLAMAQMGEELRNYTMKNLAQWSIIAYPNAEWANQVFPEFEGQSEAACEELLHHIYAAVHIDDNNDPVSIWKTLNQKFSKRVDILNNMQLSSLHFKNCLGTDIIVSLVKNHIWAGGSDENQAGVLFNPNLPTEEIFTMPLRDGVNGRVYASKPLLYNGSLIEDFYLDFEHGKVVHFDAKAGKDALASLVHFDEGSAYLGEVALVPFHSPISQSGVLFLNTLFDENASCHLALGDAYPSNLKDGVAMSKEQLKEAGANHSMTHVDFMFGTNDMCITGVDAQGNEVPIFQDGDFVF